MKFKLFMFMIFIWTFSSAQNLQVMDTTFARRNGVKSAKLYSYSPGYDKKRHLIKRYIFNSKGQLIKEIGGQINYYYYHDTTNKILMVEEKWDRFTNRSLSGTQYSCDCIKDDNSKHIRLKRTFIGKCKDVDLKSNNEVCIELIYYDSLNRDTLVSTIKNRWYYSLNDTGSMTYKYSYIQDNLVDRNEIYNYRKGKSTTTLRFKIDSFGHLLEMYKPGQDLSCDKQIFEYDKNGLLTKVKFFDCYNSVRKIYTFSYKYRRRVKNAL